MWVKFELTHCKVYKGCRRIKDRTVAVVGGGEREGCVGRAEDAARISLRSWTGGQLSFFGSRYPVLTYSQM